MSCTNFSGHVNQINQSDTILLCAPKVDQRAGQLFSPHVVIFSWMLTITCCLVVGLELGSGLVSGWLVVKHTHLYYFWSSQSQCPSKVRLLRRLEFKIARPLRHACHCTNLSTAFLPWFLKNPKFQVFVMQVLKSPENGNMWWQSPKVCLRLAAETSCERNR